MDELERKIKLLLNSLEQVDSFIYNPNDYIFTVIPDATDDVVVECLRYIIEFNQEKLKEHREKIKTLRDTMKNARDIKGEKITIVSSEKKSMPTTNRTFDYKPYIDLLFYSDLDDELAKKLSTLSLIEQKIIKFQLLKIKIQINEKIRKSIINNPGTDISKLQSDYKKIEEILFFVCELIKTEEKIADDLPKEQSKIIIVPNYRCKNSYLFEDIIKYIENKKEIKLMIEKILDGYFLKTRDTKPIQGITSNNLFEYRHPNGIRILYVVEGEYIYICSLFYKDKQKSTRIENYYQEAINRYETNKPYFSSKISTPDFFIEQDELVGQINSILEDGVLLKKVGDK